MGPWETLGALLLGLVLLVVGCALLYGLALVAGVVGTTIFWALFNIPWLLGFGSRTRWQDLWNTQSTGGTD